MVNVNSVVGKAGMIKEQINRINNAPFFSQFVYMK